MDQSDLQRFQELLEQEEFQDKLVDCKNIDEFIAFFKEYELNISDEDAKSIYEELLKKASFEELAIDDLEDVSGGGFLAGAAIIGGGIAVSYIMAKVAWKKIKKMSNYR